MASNEYPIEFRELVNTYIEQGFVNEPEIITRYRRLAVDARVPPAAVQPVLGKFLQLQIAAIQARQVLEIGTLWGYSAWWMAQGITLANPSGGKIITLEKELKHYRLASEFFLELADTMPQVQIELRHTDVMKEIASFANDQFDCVFLDADKQEYPNLLEPITRILRPGGLLIADNVLFSKGWPGTPAHDSSEAQNDPRIIGASRFNTMLAESQDFDALPLPFGFGVMLARKRL